MMSIKLKILTAHCLMFRIIIIGGGGGGGGGGQLLFNRQAKIFLTIYVILHGKTYFKAVRKLINIIIITGITYVEYHYVIIFVICIKNVIQEAYFSHQLYKVHP